jgi:hypothetical protein
MTKAKALLLVLACLAAFTVGAAPASADSPGGGGCQLCGQGPPPTPKPPPPPPDSPTGHATVRNCSLYANPNNFGYVCLGGDAGDVTTVKQILHGDPPPTCWDQPVSQSDAVSLYGLDPNPASPYYLRSCITGLDLNRSVYYQPGLQLNQEIIEIAVNSPNCPLPLKQQDLNNRRCVATLTNHQQQVVTFAKPDQADIPPVTLVTHPSTKIRTNVDSTYADRPLDAAGNPLPDRIDKEADGVHLWAEMTEYKVLPYGPDGGHAVSCKVGPDNGLNDDAQMTDPPCTGPPRLQWTYTASSADQPEQAYPLRIQADWTVFYIDGAGQARRLATFEKYDDVKLPVYDVQALVVH